MMNDRNNTSWIWWPLNLESLMLNALTDGHALDLIDVNAVGFYRNLIFKFQPALLKACKADFWLGQTHLQLVNVFNKVCGLLMQMSVDVIDHQLDVGSLLSVLNLLLASGQRSLFGNDGPLQRLDALVHFADLYNGLGQLLFKMLLCFLDLAYAPGKSSVGKVLLWFEIGSVSGQRYIYRGLKLKSAFDSSAGHFQIPFGIRLPVIWSKWLFVLFNGDIPESNIDRNVLLVRSISVAKKIAFYNIFI